MAKVNYTAEQEATLVKVYEAEGNPSIDRLAKEMGRSVKSVRGKLIHMGVYKADEKPAPKARDEGPTKKEIMADITATGFDVSGFESATKPALTRLLAHLVAEGAEYAE